MKLYIEVEGGRTDVSTCVDMLQRERGNQVADWLRVQTRELLSGVDRWTSGAMGSLVMVEGAVETRLFTGKFVNPGLYAGWNAQGHRYLLKGPWERFERTPFVQDWKAYTEVNGTTEAVKYARVFLWTSGVTSSGQVLEVAQYLIEDGSAFEVGGIDGGIKLRPAKAETMMCSEVVMQSLRLTPDAACWWDYAGALPKFFCSRGEQLEAWTQPLAGTEQWQANLVDELAVRYVRLALKKQEVVPPREEPRAIGAVLIGTGGPGSLGIVVFGSPHGLGGVGTLVTGTIDGVNDVMPEAVNGPASLRVIDPARCTVDRIVTAPGVGGVFIADGEPMQTVLKDVTWPPGWLGGRYGGVDVALDEVDLFDIEDASELAQTIYELNSVAPWSGQHVIGHLELGVRPGMRYNLSGSRADLATMNGVVQGVVDDFAQRTTTVTWGPPKQMGPQDLLERMRAMRDTLTPVSPEEIAEKNSGASWTATFGKTDKNNPGGSVPTIPAAGYGTNAVFLRSVGGKMSWVEGSTDCPTT